MSEQIEFQHIVVNLVEVEMRGPPRCRNVVGRVLDRREIVNVHVVRNDDDSSRMLSGRPFDVLTMNG